ncbi:hypothetical protein Vafri_18723, partial [Volvox africanus]
NTGGSAGAGEFSPVGAITSLLTPGVSGGYGTLGLDGTTMLGGGSSSGGLRPRRMRSQDLINAVPASPFSGSPPIGVGLVPNTTGPAAAAAAAQQLPSAFRNNLLSALSNGQAHAQMIGGGGGGGGGGVGSGVCGRQRNQTRDYVDVAT